MPRLLPPMTAPLPGRPSRWAAWYAAWPLLPALLAVLVYLPSLAGRYVYDDNMIIAENQFVKADGAVGWLLQPDYYYGVAPEALGGSKEQSYRPLGTLTHILECRVFWGEDGHDVAGGFRLTSLYLHALNALLVAALARRLFRCSALAALTAGVVFAVHPVASEAVVVASFREDLLCLWFLLTGLLCFAWRGHAPGGRGLAWSVAGAACCFGAMLSKEVGLAALPLAVVADLGFGPVPWRERRLGREAVRFGALLAVTLCYAWIRFSWAYFAAEGTTPFPGGSRWTSICTMLPVFAHYARLYLFPDILRADYMIPVRFGLFEPAVLGAGLTLAGLTALGVAAAQRSRTAGFGLLFLLVTLGPVSNLIPIRNICAERYLYVPLFGLALAAGVAAAWCGQACGDPRHRRWLLAGAAGLVVVLGVRTTRRVLDWHGNDTIWIATVRDEPLSTRGNISAAGFYNGRAQRELAEADRQRAAGEDDTAMRAASNADFAQVRLHALQITRTPWTIPDPRSPDPATAPLVDVYSDAQADRRRFEAWRLLAELDWMHAEWLPEDEPTGQALVLLRRARAEIEACRRIVDAVRARGDGLLERDNGIYDLQGRIYLKLPEFSWRAYWSLRDRAFAAQSDERQDDAIRWNRQALELGVDEAYLARLSAAQRTQIADERWRVYADLGGALEAVHQSAEAQQVHGLAVDEAQRLRRAHRWPVADAVAWVALAGAARLARPEDQRGPAPVVVRGRPLADAVALCLAAVPPPDRGTALAEARRLAALGHPAAALPLADWGLGADAPGTVADADPAGAWAARLDRCWIAFAADRPPTPGDLTTVRAALVAYVQRGGRPFVEAWQAAFDRFGARDTAPNPAADQLAVALLLRARWLAMDPFYADATRDLAGTEAGRLAADTWQIEYELWWWYRHALADTARAAEHGRAAIDTWTRLAEADRAGTMATESRTYEKLRDCALSAGDREAWDRFEAARVRLASEGR